MLHVTLAHANSCFCENFSAQLRSAGFNTSCVHDFEQLEQLLKGKQTDLILLQVDFSEGAGFTVIRKLNAAGYAVGIVMLTRDSDTDSRVRALISGADACLEESADFAEISATLHAVARRLPHRRTQRHSVSTHWRLEKNDWRLVAPDGQPFNLTAQERTFLRALMNTEEPLQAVSRKQLIAQLGHNAEVYDAHFIDALVSRLRSKLGRQFPLQTVRGIGYVLSEPVDRVSR